MRTLILFLFIATYSHLNAADSEAMDIIQRMQSKNVERWENVQGYVVAKKALGKPVITLHLPITATDGQLVGFYQASPHEIQKMMDADAGITPEQKRAMANEYSKQLGFMVEGSMKQIGLSPTAVNKFSGGFLTGAGNFLKAGAPSDAVIAERDAKDQEDIDNLAGDFLKFYQTAKFEGTEKMDGRSAYHLLSTEPGRRTISEDGVAFEPDETHMWICKKDLVILKFSVRGDLTNKGQTRRFAVEQINTDFRKIGTLYEPFKQVMRLGGVLTQKELKQMEDAQKQLEELDEQMKKLPPNQQAMMQNMMGSQLDTLRSLVNNGNMEVVSET